MIIRSRPGVEKQPCEVLVERALSQMIHGSHFTPSGVSHGLGNAPLGGPIPLDQHERTLKMILETLQMTGVLVHYQIGATRETAASTYEKTEWMIRIKFTDDPQRKVGYVADLLFHYYH